MASMTRIMAAMIVLSTTAAFAHKGVQNPVVKARMDAMGVIGKNTKALGLMAKGATAFDAIKARAAAAEIATHARQMPTLFKAPEDDPKSEALPAIWVNFADFTAKAVNLADVADQAASDISTRKNLKATLGQIGAACKSCHALYRE